MDMKTVNSILLLGILSISVDAAASCEASLNSGEGQIHTQTSKEFRNSLPELFEALGPSALLHVEALYSDLASPVVQARQDLSKGDYNLAVLQTQLTRARPVYFPTPGYENSKVNSQTINLVDMSNEHVIGSLRYNQISSDELFALRTSL